MASEKVTNYEFTVGLLVARQARGLLERLNFRYPGDRIRWIETKGWLTRTFTVKGEKVVIDVLHENLKALKAEIDSDA